MSLFSHVSIDKQEQETGVEDSSKEDGHHYKGHLGGLCVTANPIDNFDNQHFKNDVDTYNHVLEHVVT